MCKGRHLDLDEQVSVWIRDMSLSLSKAVLCLILKCVQGKGWLVVFAGET